MINIDKEKIIPKFIESLKCAWPNANGVYYIASFNRYGYKKYVFGRTLEKLEKTCKQLIDSDYWKLIDTIKIKIVSPNALQIEEFAKRYVVIATQDAKNKLETLLEDYYDEWHSVPEEFELIKTTHGDEEDKLDEEYYDRHDLSLLKIHDHETWKPVYIRILNKNLEERMINKHFENSEPKKREPKFREPKAEVCQDGKQLFIWTICGYDGKPLIQAIPDWSTGLVSFFFHYVRGAKKQIAEFGKRIREYTELNLEEEKKKDEEEKKKRQLKHKEDNKKRAEKAQKTLDELLKE